LYPPHSHSLEWVYRVTLCCGVDIFVTIFVGLFCKRDLQFKQKEKKEPANRSHPIFNWCVWDEWLKGHSIVSVVIWDRNYPQCTLQSIDGSINWLYGILYGIMVSNVNIWYPLWYMVSSMVYGIWYPLWYPTLIYGILYGIWYPLWSMVYGILYGIQR